MYDSSKHNLIFIFSGVGSPRSLSVLGQPLPSPRAISTSVHSDTSRPHTRYSLMVMQIAQITDHDLTFTPVNKGNIILISINQVQTNLLRNKKSNHIPTFVLKSFKSGTKYNQ